MDKALESLERAIALDAEWRDKAKTDRDFDGIREDERFRQLVDGEEQET